MTGSYRISTGIDGLDQTLDYLRPGDNVTWQIENIGDYAFVATQFVTKIALTGKRIVYLRFGDHEELIPSEALKKRGANIDQYVLDPSVGFETFAVQVHRVISKEELGAFFLFDCLSELQRYWFSDLMVCNFFCLTANFLSERGGVAYLALRYERHIYETISRIRRATSVLLNIRTMEGATYIHPVKASGRSSKTMFFPLKIAGGESRIVTSSSDTYAIFDIFTQTGERRDCWDSMFDSVRPGQEEPTDPDGVKLKENILMCLLGNEPKRLALCRKYFSVRDLMEIKRREIGTGCIGGKTVGMLLARNIIRDTNPELYTRRIENHDSYYIGADVFYTYAVQNNTWDLRTKMIKPEDYIRIAPEFRQRLLEGVFMPSIKDQFLSMLEYFGQSPIIVRSSSLLEDGIGNAFAGKYDSVFCPNQGTLEERYRDFEHAVRLVYASTVSPEAIRYRAERHLLDRDEQMALLVMRVSGDIHGDYYYPHIAGVGHSKNLYANESLGKENKGMLRLVFGMGTRAVDREADDYARFIRLDKPLAPFMEPDSYTASYYREIGLRDEPVPDIVSFSRLLRRTDFAAVMTELLQMLEEKYNYPVDIEYACNFTQDGEYKVNLLQCRTIQTQGLGQAGVMPKVKDFLFRISGNFMGGNACVPIRYAVFVQVENYLSLPENRKYLTARRIGELNQMITEEGAVLLGPGRWGTTTPSLGVPVTFAEISRYSCMCELSYQSHGLHPDLSYGSHFFQDLVESGIHYAAVYRESKNCIFREDLFEHYPDVYEKLTGDEILKDVIHVHDFGPGGAILYSELKSSDCFLAITSENGEVPETGDVC